MTKSAFSSARAISVRSPKARPTACQPAAWQSTPVRPRERNFLLFKTFWIEKPAANANSIVVHALLDSESTTAAYRFTVRPGDTTVFDVELAVYPRIALDHAGLMPMTSMFFFGPNDRNEVDDFRPSVHDSDGIAIYNGRGEELWRPLNNPRDLQISTFADHNPRG
jgi:glucans biosynthesis protein